MVAVEHNKDCDTICGMDATVDEEFSRIEFIRVSTIIQNPGQYSKEELAQAKDDWCDVWKDSGMLKKAALIGLKRGIRKCDLQDYLAEFHIAAWIQTQKVDLCRDDYGDGRNNPLKHVFDISMMQAKAEAKKDTQRNIFYTCIPCNARFSANQYNQHIMEIVRGRCEAHEKKHGKMTKLEKKQMSQGIWHSLWNLCPLCKGHIRRNTIHISLTPDKPNDEVKKALAIVDKAIERRQEVNEKLESLLSDRVQFYRDARAIKKEYGFPERTAEIFDLLFPTSKSPSSKVEATPSIIYQRLMLADATNPIVIERIKKNDKGFTDNYFLILMDKFSVSNIEPILKHIHRIRDAVNHYYGYDVWSRLFNSPSVEEIFYIEHNGSSDEFVKIGTGTFIKHEGDFGTVEIAGVKPSADDPGHRSREERMFKRWDEKVIEVERVHDRRKWVIVDFLATK